MTHVFLRLNAPSRMCIGMMLNQTIPGQWTWSKYAVGQPARDGDGRKAHFILVENDQAAAKVFWSAPTYDAHVKQMDRVEPSDELRRLVLYGSQSPFYPWETKPRPEKWEDWRERSGYVVLVSNLQPRHHPTTGRLILSNARFVERNTPLTKADLQRIIGFEPERFWAASIPQSLKNVDILVGRGSTDHENKYGARSRNKNGLRVNSVMREMMGPNAYIACGTVVLATMGARPPYPLN